MAKKILNQIKEIISKENYEKGMNPEAHQFF